MLYLIKLIKITIVSLIDLQKIWLPVKVLILNCYLNDEWEFQVQYWEFPVKTTYIPLTGNSNKLPSSSAIVQLNQVEGGVWWKIKSMNKTNVKVWDQKNSRWLKTIHFYKITIISTYWKQKRQCFEPLLLNRYLFVIFCEQSLVKFSNSNQKFKQKIKSKQKW